MNQQAKVSGGLAAMLKLGNNPKSKGFGLLLSTRLADIDLSIHP
jgi:hypothetical protein